MSTYLYSGSADKSHHKSSSKRQRPNINHKNVTSYADKSIYVEHLYPLQQMVIVFSQFSNVVQYYLFTSYNVKKKSKSYTVIL